MFDPSGGFDDTNVVLSVLMYENTCIREDERCACICIMRRYGRYL